MATPIDPRPDPALGVPEHLQEDGDPSPDEAQQLLADAIAMRIGTDMAADVMDLFASLDRFVYLEGFVHATRVPHVLFIPGADIEQLLRYEEASADLRGKASKWGYVLTYFLDGGDNDPAFSAHDRFLRALGAAKTAIAEAEG